MQSVTDAELVTRSRRRDAAAFGSLVERHQDLVFGVAFARCGDPELASDLVQDAFVVAWKNLDRLRDADRVGPWVAGIARNLAAGAACARAREARLVPEPATVPTPEDAALEREGRELIHGALAELPATHREVLVLHYFQARSIAAIAEGIGISQDLVKQRLSRGRRAVREHLARLLDDGHLRLVPRAGLVAGVLAALSVGTSEAMASTTAGKLFVMATASKKLVLGGLLALALAGGATWMIHARSSSAARTASSAPAREPAATGSRGKASPAGPDVHRVTPAERAALLAGIREARLRRPTSAPPAPPTTMAAPALPTDQAVDGYVLAALDRITPLLEDCFAEGQARIPDLAGGVVIDFTIEGEPAVGGLVGESTIAPAASTLIDPAVRDCIQETIYAIEIDPPDHGVMHRLRTSIELGPDREPTSAIDTSLVLGAELDPGAPRVIGDGSDSGAK